MAQEEGDAQIRITVPRALLGWVTALLYGGWYPVYDLNRAVDVDHESCSKGVVRLSEDMRHTEKRIDRLEDHTYDYPAH